MNFYADSNYIHARIYALHGLLLAERDYYDIAKNGHFQSLLPGLDTNNIKNDSTIIKEKLFESHVSIIISLAEASASSRRLFILFLRYFETLNLKLLCAEAFGQEPSPSIWYNIGNFAVLHRGMSAGAAGIRSVTEFTRDTWMRDIFADGDVSAFEDAERLIDRAAFRMAADYSCSVCLTDRKGSLKLASGLAAYLRLAWSRRLQYICHMDPAEIRDYTGLNIPLPESDGTLRQYTLERENRLKKHLQGDYSRDVEGLASAERTMKQVLMRDAGRMFHENFHSGNTVVCYLVLLYRQIMNLFSIVDGLRFGLPPDMIMENVICEE